MTVSTLANKFFQCALYYKNSRRGSLVITALGIGTVLLFVVIGIHTFSSYRIQTVVQESKKVKALGIAEAGLELILAELAKNPNFSTHELNSQLNWLSVKDREQSLQDNPGSVHNFSLDSGTSGTYSGKFGDGEFKVHVGYIPYQDDNKTLNVDESISYIKVEALGKYKDTIRRVEAVVNRRFPAREFLMYDGGVLSMVYGLANNSDKNVFSTGHLYGHHGIEIGRILMSSHSPVPPGTTQELRTINAMISGAGGIFIYSPIKANFSEKRGFAGKDTMLQSNVTFPSGGNYSSAANEKRGELPQQLDGKTPDLPADIRPWVKDRTDKMSIPLDDPPFSKYKKDAKTSDGIFFSNSSSDKGIQYRIPNGWKGNETHLDAVFLDFGNGKLRVGNMADYQTKMKSENFNSLIYSEKNIVLMGNPPVDINIISEGNIFMAGDFNQAGDPNNVEHAYGLPQRYDGDPTDDENFDYRDDIKNIFENDATIANNSDGYRSHVAATIIAKERIVYDYRSPVDCFENELYPFMKKKLAECIAANGNTVATDIVNPTITSDFAVKSDISTSIFDFFDDYKGAPNIKTTLAETINTKASDTGKLTRIDFDDLCKEVWTEYKTNYNSSSMKDDQSNDGVYEFLKDLRSEANNTQDDYLYYPEITHNGMFISCAKLNSTFYAGPDLNKQFNEIGNSNADTSIGINYENDFIHRLYGSEINLRTQNVHNVLGSFYTPGIRRKIYDPNLPHMGLKSNKYELSSFIVIFWEETAASNDEYNNF